MQHAQTINHFLVTAFQNILKSEEQYLTSGRYDNLSLKEIHLIEAVCQAVDAGDDHRAKAIAARLHITAGSLTTAVNILEAKGYLVRTRSSGDKRSVQLVPTEAGRRVDALHAAFHREMVQQILDVLSEEQVEALIPALKVLSDFFDSKWAAHHPVHPSAPDEF